MAGRRVAADRRMWRRDVGPVAFRFLAGGGARSRAARGGRRRRRGHHDSLRSPAAPRHDRARPDAARVRAVERDGAGPARPLRGRPHPHPDPGTSARRGGERDGPAVPRRAAEDGAALGPAGWSAQFWTRARPAPATFTEVQRLSTRPPAGTPSRAYGGVASDLDHDGAPDLAIVNEDTADLVVFLNRGPAGFASAGARYPLGRRASPSEAADFDRDGHTDIAVANITDGTVSILLGRGDGTLRARAGGRGRRDAAGHRRARRRRRRRRRHRHRELRRGRRRGAGERRRALPRGAPASSPGRAGEWALAAADMDEDGLLDLVVGAQQDQRVVTLRNAGNVSFAPLGSQAAGGGPWMLVTGDLDGDGHEDVATVNGLIQHRGRAARGRPRRPRRPRRPCHRSLRARLRPGRPRRRRRPRLGDLELQRGLAPLREPRGDPRRRRASWRRGRRRPARSCSTPTATATSTWRLIDEEADEVIVVHNGG